MICCSQKDIVEGADYEKVQNQLVKISIQIEPIWRGLYLCRQCKTYWEEQFVDDRFGGNPYLKRVAIEYVKDEWGTDYLVE